MPAEDCDSCVKPVDPVETLPLMVYTVLASANMVSEPKLFTSSKNGRTYTVYVSRSTLELMSGPRMRIILLSGGAMAAVRYGLMVTVAGLVARLIELDAARLKSNARRCAAVVA